MHVGPQTNRFWKIRIGNEKIGEEGGRRSILVSPPAEGKLAPILFRATQGHPSNQATSQGRSNQPSNGELNVNGRLLGVFFQALMEDSPSKNNNDHYYHNANCFLGF